MVRLRKKNWTELLMVLPKLNQIGMKVRAPVVFFQIKLPLEKTKIYLLHKTNSLWTELYQIAMIN